jgi:hypothetical protein
VELREGICNNIFVFNPVACCFVYKAKTYQPPRIELHVGVKLMSKLIFFSFKCRPSKQVQMLSLQTCIRDMRTSNLGRDT